MPITKITKVDTTGLAYRLQFDSSPTVAELLSILTKVPAGQRTLQLVGTVNGHGSVCANPVLFTFKSAGDTETDVPVV